MQCHEIVPTVKRVDKMQLNLVSIHRDTIQDVEDGNVHKCTDGMSCFTSLSYMLPFFPRPTSRSKAVSNSAQNMRG